MTTSPHPSETPTRCLYGRPDGECSACSEAQALHAARHPSESVEPILERLGELGVPPEALSQVRESLHPSEALAEVAAMAHREADTGAPGGMVAVYVELALRHLCSRHAGYWADCSPCHEALGQPWPSQNAPSQEANRG